MLDASELEAMLASGYEQRAFELKGAGLRTDKQFFAKVTRAALSMGNLRDGGFVVIGIDDKNPASLGPGLSDEQFASWSEYDHVARGLADYADPPLHFEMASYNLSSGARVALLKVSEFSDMPHLCAKAYEPDLRKGALYVRTRKLPETAEVASSVEMRDVLDLATEKALRSYVETAQRAGVRFEAEPVVDEAEVSARAFEAQRRVAWS